MLQNSPAFQRAYLNSYPASLAKSGQWAKYGEVLSHFPFLAAKLRHPEFGVQALIDDYDWVETADEAAVPATNRQALQWIQGALRLSAHIVSRDDGQLAGQLWGRLQSFDSEPIRCLLAGTTAKHWLRPTTPNAPRRTVAPNAERS